MFDDYNENEIVDEYTDVEHMAYGIISLVNEVRFLRKRNKELQNKVDEHNRQIRERIKEQNSFIGEILTSLVNNTDKED